MHRRRFGKFSRAIGVLVVISGVLVLAGWQLDISLWRQIRPEWGGMNPVTALCFIVAGLSLVAGKRAEQLLKSANEDLEKRISERLEQLTQSEEQVRQLQKMDAIGALAGGIAHDFNNLLAAINMYCDLIQEDVDKAEMVLGIVREIKQVTARGASLTQQLLVFSRKQLVHVTSVDVNDSIQTLLKMLDRLIGENIRIVTKLEADLRPIRADSGQIEQVILNLILNARDAIPNGGTISLETANVTLTEEFASKHLAVKPGPHVALTISDTGIGMDSATQSHLFEPFFTTKPMGKGNGLGLSTTYGIVKQHQGTIWVYSEIGRGSVFKVYFPATDRATVVPEPKPEGSTVRKGSETILLVEDEDRLRTLYSDTLRRFGYEVMAARNGKDVLRLLEAHPSKFQLLLTDVAMPEMGGVELSALVKVKSPRMRILFMSGYANTPLTGLLEPDGPEESLAFIQKPFDTQALLTKVREVLDA